MIIKLCVLLFVAHNVLSRPNQHDTVLEILTHEEIQAARQVRELRIAQEAVQDFNEVIEDSILSRQRRSQMELDEWLSSEQKEKLTAMKAANSSPEDLKAKSLEYFDQLPAEVKTEWRRKYKQRCAAWIDKVASAEEKAEVKALYASKDLDTLEAKVTELKGRLDDETRKRVDLWQDVCKELWAAEDLKAEAGRLRRELGEDEDDWETWFSDAQRKAIRQLKSEDASPKTVMSKIREYFEDLPEETQDRLRNEFNAKCLQWTETDGENSGKFGELCEQLWLTNDAQRSRRAAADLDATMDKHLGWLSDEQKAELKALKAEGADHEALKKKVWDFFNNLSGDQKELATEKLKSSCSAWLTEAASAEEIAELKRLHENSHGECKKKVLTYLERLPEDRKNQVKKYLDICEKVWYGTSDSHQHHRRSIKEKFLKFFSWMNDEQRTEIISMKEQKLPYEVIREKMWQFYQETSGSLRRTANEKIKKACHVLNVYLFGPEKAKAIKQMLIEKDSSTEINDEIKEYIEQLSNVKQQQIANVFVTPCIEIYDDEIKQRKNRGTDDSSSEEASHSRTKDTKLRKLEEYFTTHLSWLTDAQKEEMRTMKTNGASKKDLQAKVFEFYEATSGDTKEQATEKLKGGCRALLAQVVGADKAAELKSLKEGGASKDELTNKANEMLSSITDEDKKKTAEEYGAACKKIFGVSRRRRDQHAKLEEYFTSHLSWLTDAQKEEMRTMKTNGASKKDLQAKVFEFYEATSGDTKEQATEKLKGGCRALLAQVVGADKAAELKSLKEGGASKDELTNKANEMLSSITDEDKKKTAEEYGAACKKIFGVSRRRRDQHAKLEEYFTSHLSWLTDAQKEEMRTMKTNGASKKDLQAKVFEFYEATSGDTKEQATEKLKGGCRALLAQVVGADKAAELKSLKEGGASKDELTNKANEMLSSITDEDKKKTAEEYGAACKKIFGVSRRRRDQHAKLEEYFTSHLSWLTDAQKEEMRTMKTNGASKKDLQAKVFEFYEATSGDTKEQATEKLKGGCRALLAQVVGADKAAELKSLKEGGASKDELAKKVTEMLGGITDEDKKKTAEEYGAACKKIFGVSRRRRDHHGKLEEYFTTHLSWLTDAQKEEMKTMKANGASKKDLQAKVFEFYEATSGDTKEQATEKLKGGCRALLAQVVGADKAAELKSLKEGGASKDELTNKANEMLSSITDEDKKKTAEEYGAACKKIFGVSRRRRDQHAKLEEYFTSHLSWLTDAQKEEMRTMKTNGASKKNLQAKVFEFYEATSGDTKEQATEKLKGGCRALLAQVVGADKAAELKSLKEGGASKDELTNKANEMLSSITDEDKKKTAEEYGAACKKIFGVSRRRRDQHAKLEEYFTSHLSWLTDAQKEEMRTMKTNGASKKDLQAKVFEFYEATSGDTKEQATEKLKGGCRALLAQVVGADKAAELKSLKEGGASKDELAKKVTEMLGGITDEDKKKTAEEYGAACKKIFGVSRRRRDHHGKLEEYFTTHLSWLTDAQKEEMKTMKANGASKKDLQAKVFEFYEATSGDTKEQATEKLKGGCRALLAQVVGADKAAELKSLKEGGASKDELTNKANEMLSSITDEDKKKTAEEYGAACKKIFGVSRRRRDHHGKLEEYFTTHLSWLTDAQKEEMKTMKANGASKKDLQAKVFEFYEATSGDTKEQATEKLKGGCRALLAQVVGADKAAELKSLKEGGASKDELTNKANEMLSSITDEDKKKTAEEYGAACKKIFGVSRRRRDHHGKLEEYFTTHLSWLTDAQKEEMKTMKANGASKKDLQAKVFEFYEATSGDTKEQATEKLKGGCRALLAQVVGADKAAELKSLKEGGASKDELTNKANEMLSSITDEDKKKTAEEYGAACKKIFGVSRRRRDQHAKLEEYFTSHLSWLTDAQKEEMRTMKTNGASKKDLQAKVFEFYEATSGDTKEQATEKLKGGCRALLAKVVGADKAAELKSLKEGGASKDELANKANEMLSSITDEDKKKTAEEYGAACKKIFGVSRRRRDQHAKLEEYFTSHLSWLTDAQKDEMRTMKTNGASKKEISAKVLEFYDATTGETKDQATEKLKGGCRALLARVIGDEKASELKVLKESGATKEEISNKFTEIVSGITDDEKKRTAEEYGVSCRKIFGVSRRRREQSRVVVHKQDIFNHFASQYLTWLSIEELHMLRTMKADGRSMAIIMERVYDILINADEKKADIGIEHLHRGCKSKLQRASDEENRQTAFVEDFSTICIKVHYLVQERSMKSDIPAVDDFLSTLLKPSLEKGKVDECIDYLHHVADAEERAEMRRLHIEKNFEQLRSRITYYISRFDNEKNEKYAAAQGLCINLLQDDS